MLRVNGQMAEARGKLAPDEATMLLQNIHPPEGREEETLPRAPRGRRAHGPRPFIPPAFPDSRVARGLALVIIVGRYV